MNLEYFKNILLIRVLSLLISTLKTFRKDLLKILTIPLLIIFSVEYLLAYIDTYPQFAYAGYYKTITIVIRAILYAYIAFICHRLILLGNNSVPQYGIRTWNPSFNKYFVCYLLVIVAYLVVYFITTFSLAIISTFVEYFVAINAGPWITPVPLSSTLLNLPAYYLAGRLLLALPPVAIGKTSHFKKAWQDSRGYGIQLAILIFLVPLAIHFGISQITSMENSTLLVVLALILFTIFLPLGIIILTLSYQILDKQTQKINHKAQSNQTQDKGTEVDTHTKNLGESLKYHLKRLVIILLPAIAILDIGLRSSMEANWTSYRYITWPAFGIVKIKSMKTDLLEVTSRYCDQDHAISLMKKFDRIAISDNWKPVNHKGAWTPDKTRANFRPTHKQGGENKYTNRYFRYYRRKSKALKLEIISNSYSKEIYKKITGQLTERIVIRGGLCSIKLNISTR